MRCILCQKISLFIICKSCQNNFLKPHRSLRVLENGTKVYSFYKYKDIDMLLKTKHTHIGAAIYHVLAMNSFYQFGKEFIFEKLSVIPIDDNTKSGYSHTAILAKSLQNKKNRVYFNKLRAQNNVNYSGKDLEYRKNNPRNFNFFEKDLENIVLVDDIITTGTTILEAVETIEKVSKSPLFALTLADARDL